MAYLNIQKAEFNRATENLIEIAWKYESLKVEYDFLTNTDITVNTPDTEYTVLAKRIDDGRYVQLGGVFGNELLCRKRFEEKVRNQEIFYGIDLSTAVFAKRETVTLTEEWEAMGNVDLEM